MHFFTNDVNILQKMSFNVVKKVTTSRYFLQQQKSCQIILKIFTVQDFWVLKCSRPRWTNTYQKSIQSSKVERSHQEYKSCKTQFYKHPDLACKQLYSVYFGSLLVLTRFFQIPTLCDVFSVMACCGLLILNFVQIMPAYLLL